MMTEQSKIVQQIAENQWRYALFPGSDGKARKIEVVVGVSGGADSICLLHLLKQLSLEWHLSLHIAHLDHNLRPNSQIDAAFVEQLANDWHIPYHGYQLPPNILQNIAGGLENAARQARYAFLCHVTQTVTPTSQIPIVAVAHHADDQAETVLINFIRGSGLQGLGGMKRVSVISDPTIFQKNLENLASVDFNCSPDRSIRLVRPLLDTPRLQIEQYLQAYQLRWREDETNQEDLFLRNRLRHRVMPILQEFNPNFTETVRRTAQIAQDESERSRHIAQQKLIEIKIEPSGTHPADHILLDLEKLLTLDIASQRGVLRQALAKLQNGLHDISFEHIEGLIELLKERKGASGPHPLFADISWTVIGDYAFCQEGSNHSARSVFCGSLLSLHKMDALPFPITQPHFDKAWQSTVRQIDLPSTGRRQFSDGWLLQIEQLHRSQLPTDWKSRGQKWATYLDTAKIGQLILTTSKVEFQFAPLGMKGRHKRLGDFFTDRKIPILLRAGWPLLVDKETDRILWVCGLLPADDAKITEQTERVLYLRWVHEVV